jgi:hypothetical protein
MPDPTEALKQIDASRSQVEYLRSELERTKALAKTAKEEYDAAVLAHFALERRLCGQIHLPLFAHEETSTVAVRSDVVTTG